MGFIKLTITNNNQGDIMGSAILNTVWVGSFRASRADAEQLHATILVKAEEEGLGELVSNVSASANGLTQFMIMPCSSKESFPDNVAWEKLVAFTALKTAGTEFSIKRLYVAEI